VWIKSIAEKSVIGDFPLISVSNFPAASSGPFIPGKNAEKMAL